MIKNSNTESRKEWMIEMFEKAGKRNPNNQLYQFWQQDNHPIEIWSNEVIKQKIDYIHMNPVEQGWVEEPEEYSYSSAKDYADKKGVLEHSIS